MGRLIKHFGVVEEVQKTSVRVKIVQASACSGCSAQSFCSASECKEKIIDVETPEAHHYEKGETVMLQGEIAMGMQAVLWAYVVPFIVVIVALFVAMQMTQNDELMAALLSLMALVPYYILLYLLRNRLKKKFSFTIKSIK